MTPARELGILNREGMKALSDGNIGNATFLLSQALDKAKSFRTRLNEAKIHNNLGLAALISDNPAKASRHFDKALECVILEIGKDNHLYRSIVKNQTKANTNQGANS